MSALQELLDAFERHHAFLSESGGGVPTTEHRLVAALKIIDERLRAQEACPAYPRGPEPAEWVNACAVRYPHVWQGIRADGEPLGEHDPWKLMVREACKHCGVPRGDAL